MTINKTQIEKYFSIHDIVASGGGRTYFKITEILDNRIKIQPTQAKTASRLRYDKLSIVIDNFDRINPKKIELSVGKILEDNHLQDTQNESYLYGLAKEYLNRQNLLPKSFLESEFENGIENSIKIDDDSRQERLKNARKKPEKVFTTTSTYKRNPDVVVEVLKRANGICEHCKNKAPFIKAKDNTPYLEVHHKIQLANGGDDTIENALALCPNCHREMHFGIKA